jgi:hypothetical protein
LPQGRDLFTVKKAGTVTMVILPYTVPAGAKHPVAQPGEMHYSRDYAVHRNFGASGKDYAICPRVTMGGRCPICEAVRSQLADGVIDKAMAKKLGPSARTLSNVWLVNETTVVLFDTSVHTFTKFLNPSVEAKVKLPNRQWIDYFADHHSNRYGSRCA